MIDLDSNPTKLIEIVEIGKQLLMTRGSLTTFSIANDVAKYFAIIPAMFAATYPVLNALNIMRLHSPHVGDPERRDLQRADHHRADSAGARAASSIGPSGAASILRRNFIDLRHRRPDRPVHRDQAASTCSSSPCTWCDHDPQTNPPRRRADAGALRHHGVALSRASSPVSRSCSSRARRTARSSRATGSVVGSRSSGRRSPRPYYFHPRPVGRRRGLRRHRLGGHEQGPDRPEARRHAHRAGGGQRGAGGRRQKGHIPSDMVTASASGLDPHISPANAQLQVARVARERGADSAAVRALVDAHTQGRQFGVFGEPRGQRARAQPRARQRLPAAAVAGGRPWGSALGSRRSIPSSIPRSSGGRSGRRSTS